jgi:hypothetical protein
MIMASMMTSIQGRMMMIARVHQASMHAQAPKTKMVIMARMHDDDGEHNRAS